VSAGGEALGVGRVLGARRETQGRRREGAGRERGAERQRGGGGGRCRRFPPVVSFPLSLTVTVIFSGSSLARPVCCFVFFVFVCFEGGGGRGVRRWERGARANLANSRQERIKQQTGKGVFLSLSISLTVRAVDHDRVGLGLLLQGREALDLDAVLVVGLGQVEEDADGGDALIHVGQGKVAVAGGVEQRADKVGRLSDVFFRFFFDCVCLFVECCVRGLWCCVCGGRVSLLGGSGRRVSSLDADGDGTPLSRVSWKRRIFFDGRAEKNETRQKHAPPPPAPFGGKTPALFLPSALSHRRPGDLVVPLRGHLDPLGQRDQVVVPVGHPREVDDRAGGAAAVEHRLLLERLRVKVPQRLEEDGRGGVGQRDGDCGFFVFFWCCFVGLFCVVRLCGVFFVSAGGEKEKRRALDRKDKKHAKLACALCVCFKSQSLPYLFSFALALTVGVLGKLEDHLLLGRQPREVEHGALALRDDQRLLHVVGQVGGVCCSVGCCLLS